MSRAPPRPSELEQLRARFAELEAENERLRRLAADRSDESAMPAVLGQAILDSAADYAIFTIDAERRITIWNSGARNLFGWDAADVIGRDAAIVFTPEDRDAGIPDAELGKARAHGRAENERWHIRKDGSCFWASGLMMPLRDRNGFLKIIRDRTSHRRAEERQQLLINELNHRVRNILATIQAISRQTLRDAGSLEAFRERFEARLLAISKTHDLLAGASWHGAGLRHILQDELAPYLGSGAPRVELRGEDVMLPSGAALAAGLVFHELTTNAVKYGALSVPTGRVEVSWTVRPEPDGRRLDLSWIETGGPKVSAPLRRGFGSRLIEQSMAQEMGGTARLDFVPEGLRCTMDLSLPEPGAPLE